MDRPVKMIAAIQGASSTEAQELLRAVWGYLDTDISTRTVDFAVARLRRKIEIDHHHPQFIRTAHGDGYCLRGVVDESTVKPRGKLRH